MDAKQLVSALTLALKDDLSAAYKSFAERSETPVAALAVFADEAAEVIFILAEYSADGFTRTLHEVDETYRGEEVCDPYDRRPYFCDAILERLHMLSEFEPEELSRLIIRGLSDGVKRFHDSGVFAPALGCDEKLLMLWVHDTIDYAGVVMECVEYCNSTSVSEWFAKHYCYAQGR